MIKWVILSYSSVNIEGELESVAIRFGHCRSLHTVDGESVNHSAYLTTEQGWIKQETHQNIFVGNELLF